MTNSSLLQAVVEVAQLAGRTALRHFGGTLSVEAKSDGSPVTIADRHAELVMREWLERHFPDDGVMGEELGISKPEARRRWIVDPIDGTKSFVRGVPLWGTLVAVAEGEQVLGGAIYCPAAGELVAAAVGEGCWWNGARCHVSRVQAMDDATVLTTDERFAHDDGQRDRWRELAGSSAVSRTWGDCYGYVLVASGRAEVMVDGTMAPWDSAALQPVIEEAGGVFTDWRGNRTAFGGDAIATNAALAEAVRRVLVDPSEREAHDAVR